ncbi:MAG: prepilin peptidase, partial [Vibrionaceae bacterium]|nr:prepilin peptidase [Vibrionaceae bacterium]
MEVFQYYPWLFVVFAVVFGLIVGSFLNVVIYRLPKIMELEWRRECAESFPEYNIAPPKEVVTLSVPRSSCQQCGTPIRIRDNIPVISWLLLKGKCHNCSTPI